MMHTPTGTRLRGLLPILVTVAVFLVGSGGIGWLAAHSAGSRGSAAWPTTSRSSRTS